MTVLYTATLSILCILLLHAIPDISRHFPHLVSFHPMPIVIDMFMVWFVDIIIISKRALDV